MRYCRLIFAAPAITARNLQASATTAGPNLYRCAVGNVGVYDLAKVYTDDSDVNTAERRFFDLTMGTEDFDLYSPHLVAHKIKIPVLLAAGEVDETAPPVHTRKMQSALERNGIPVETVIYPKEGHGNYLMVNKLDFAERLLAFLDKHIGAKAKPAGQ